MEYSNKKRNIELERLGIILRAYPEYFLCKSSLKKAKLMNLRLVFRRFSQFFQSLLHFSNQANDLSTTQRCGMTANLCNSLRLATSTRALIKFLTAKEKGSPV